MDLLSKSTVSVLKKGSEFFSTDDHKCHTYTSTNSSKVKFALCNIDDDGIPELIVQSMIGNSYYNSYYTGCSVFTYKNGKIHRAFSELGHSFEGVYPKTGVFVMNIETDGYKLTGYYKLKGKKTSQFLTKYRYSPFSTRTNYFSGSFSYDSYENEISKSKFNSILKKAKGTTKLTKVKLRSNTKANRKKFLK